MKFIKILLRKIKEFKKCLKKNKFARYYLIFVVLFYATAIFYGLQGEIGKELGKLIEKYGISSFGIAAFVGIGGLIFLWIFIKFLLKLTSNKKFVKFVKKWEKFKYDDVLIILIYFLISILSLWKILPQYGVIGFRHDWGIPQYSEQIKTLTNYSSFIWKDYALGGTHLYESPYLFSLILGHISFLEMGGVILSKAIVIFCIFSSGLFMFLFCKKNGLNKKASFISGFFYMSSPIIFNRVVAGHITYLVSYALAPLSLYLFLICIRNDKIKYRCTIIAGIITALACTQIHFFLMIFALLFFFSFLEIKNVKKKIITSLLIITITFLIHIPWIFPAILDFQNKIQFVSNMVTPKYVSTLSHSLFQSILLLGYRYLENALLSNFALLFLWTFSMLILSVFSLFLPFFLKFQNKKGLLIAIATIFSLFFSKGFSPPFGELFSIFSYVFREVYHLMFIPTFFYSVLIGFFVNEFYKEKNYRKRKVPFQEEILLFSIILLFVTICAIPVLSGDFLGQIQQYKLGNEYYYIFKSFSKDKEDYRILWLPMMQPFQYENLSYYGLDPMILFSPKPTFQQQLVSGSYGEKYTALINNLLHNEITTHLGEILAFSNTKYLVFRKNMKSKFWNWSFMYRYPEISEKYKDNKKILNILRIQEDIVQKYSVGNITVYENKKNLPHIYATKDAFLVAGDLSIMVLFPELKKVLNISNAPALFFASQLENKGIENYVNKVLIQDGSFFDLLILKIPNKYIFDPGNYVKEIDAEKGWVRLFNPSFGWWWYNWKYSLALENVAFTRTNDTLEIPVNIDKQGEYDVWVKLYFGKNTSSIKFSIDKLSKTILSNSSEERFKWIKVFSSLLKDGKKVLKIKSYGENVIARIVITEKSEIEKAKNEINELLNKKQIIVISSPKLQELHRDEVQVFFNRTQIFTPQCIPILGKVNISSATVPYCASSIINVSYPVKKCEVLPFENVSNTSCIFNSNKIIVTFCTTIGTSQKRIIGYLDIKITPKCEYFNISKDSKSVSAFAYFNKNSSYDEFSILFLPINLSLDNYPNIEIKYSVKDPKIQFIEIVFSILYQENGTIKNGTIYGAQHGLFEIPAPTFPKKFTVNLLKVVKEEFPEGKDFRVGWLGLYLHKIWGANATGNMSGYYQFDIHEAKFFTLTSLETEMQGSRVYIPKKGRYKVFIFVPKYEENKVFSFRIKNQTKSINISSKGWYNLGEYELKDIENLTFHGTTIGCLLFKSIVHPSNLNESILLTYKKIDPTRYNIHVNSKFPFFLIFNENFDNFWRINAQSKHFKANGFANGFFVLQTENFKISLTSWIQEIYCLLLVFVKVFVLILLIILILPLIEIGILSLIVFICQKNKKLLKFKIKFSKRLIKKKKELIKKLKKHKNLYKFIILTSFENWCLLISLTIIFISLIPLAIAFIFQYHNLKKVAEIIEGCAYIILWCAIILKLKDSF